MAVIRRAAGRRLRRCDGPGWRRARGSVIAGQADGLGRLTVRFLTLGPDGRSARSSIGVERVLVLLSGRMMLMDSDGATYTMEEGDAAILAPGERHHFAALSPGGIRLLSVEGQG